MQDDIFSCALKEGWLFKVDTNAEKKLRGKTSPSNLGAIK